MRIISGEKYTTRTRKYEGMDVDVILVARRPVGAPNLIDEVLGREDDAPALQLSL
jgi:hypothetical protein